METGRGERLNDFNSIGQDRNAATEKVLIQVACFLHRELPVRLAHRAVKLEASSLLIKSGTCHTRNKTVFLDDFYS